LQKLCGQGLDLGPRIVGEQHHFEKLEVGQVFRSGGDDALAQPFTAIPLGMRCIADHGGEVAGPERFVYVRQVRARQVWGDDGCAVSVSNCRFVYSQAPRFSDR
jgi:hypothetical protein